MIEKVRIAKVSYQDKDKNGKPLTGKYGPYFRVGLLTDRYGETYINGFSKTNCKDMEGKEVELEIYDEEYNGKMYKKFKFPQKGAQLEARVKALEDRVSKIEFHLAKPEKEEKEEEEDDFPTEPDPNDIPF